MRRLLLALFLLAAPVAAHAQPIGNLTRVSFVAAGGDCTAIPCSDGTALKMLCRNSTTSIVLYACDSSTDLYAPVASVDPFPGSISVPSGSSVGYEGAGGDTYSLRDPLTGCMNYYQDGVLSMEMCPGYARVFCGSNGLATAPGGAFCWDGPSGFIRFKDARGEWGL